MPSQKSLARERIKRGLKELERGRPEAARPLLEQAVALDPGDAHALGYLGTALLHLGETAPAVARLEQARARLPTEAWIAGNLAEGHARSGNPAAAVDTFREAARLDPSNLSFQLGIATSLALQGRHEEAAQALEALLRLSPGHPLLWFNLGTVRRDQHRPDDAVRCFRYALEAQPDWPEARNSLGAALHALLRFDEAEAAYRACIGAQPERIDFRVNLASLLIDVGRDAEAEALCRSIVAAAPQLAVAHRFLAAALMQQGKVVQALDEERIVAELEPASPDAASSLASTLASLGRTDEAWTEFERALALPGDPAPVRHARALALLAHGRLDAGWADYDARPASLRFADAYPDHPRCRTLQSDSDSRPTLVHEQGLGDELFFLRFARTLQKLGMRPRYASSPKLRPLLNHAEPVAEFIATRDIGPGTPVMPIGDLPHVLRRYRADHPLDAAAADDAADPPAPLRLHPEPVALDAMRRRLRDLGPPPYIAVTWAGGVPPGEQRHDWTLFKTVDPALLGSALRGVPGTLICVQRKPADGDVRVLQEAAGRPVHDCSAFNDALAEMLALLALVDDYVGVSNTNMHIRAGAGRAARVLMPAPAEWRWPGDGAGTPWFPGFTCYRQRHDGAWDAALAALREDLLRAHG